MAETVKKSRIVSAENDQNLEEAFMEEFNLRLKKCMSQDDLQNSDQQLEGGDSPLKTNGIASSEFIKAEQEHYYEEPCLKQNGFHKEDESFYENIGHQTEKTEIINRTDQQQYIDMSIEQEQTPQSQDDDVSAVYEDIDDDRIVSQKPNLTLTDLSDVKEIENELRSAKDRMLLSTDAGSCLLFTQTVTSPMLTPSEENIDFLKGFRRESDNGDSVTADIDEVKKKEEKEEEIIYENSEFLKNRNNDVMYENLKEAETIIYENLKDLNGKETDEVIYQNIEELRCLEEKQNGVTEEEEIEENSISEPIEELEETITNIETKSVDIVKQQITKFENDESTQVTESYVETTTIESHQMTDKGLKKKKSKKSRKEEKENISVNETNNDNTSDDSFYHVNVKSLCRSFGDLTKIDDGKKRCISDRTRTKSLSDAMFSSNKLLENVFSGVSVRALREKFHINGGNNRLGRNSFDRDKYDVKSSFNKFDALQKKNVLHVRSSDSSKAQEKFNGSQIDNTNCRSCGKVVFQMEQIKAEKAVWHKNCFRCKECSKQLNVDTYQSNEGTVYCKPHFKALFAPKVVEDDTPQKPRKPELIIRENQPIELPPDVVRASDKPDLGLEELQSLNVKQRFEVFEHHQCETVEDRNLSAINVKRSPSILSKLAKFQAKGMDIGVSDDALNGIPFEESSSEAEGDEEEEETIEGEDADLIRAKRVQKEKPFHFTGMSDVKSMWEHGDQHSTRDERREERKQEIQSIRNKLFMGKQGKMKEAYQQAVMESESCTNLRKEPIEIADNTKLLKERFEKGEVATERNARDKDDEEEVYESEISKKSRSLFLELDANASKAPQLTPVTPKVDIKKARDASTPEKEDCRDPEIVRSEEFIEDSVIAKQSHTATKMLNKFRQMEENLSKEPQPTGLKPLKRFTPPPEPVRSESNSEAESGSEEESEEDEQADELDHSKLQDDDLIEAQKAARAKQLRAKFERWEANEIKKEQNSINIIEEIGDEQSQIESTKTLRARFESMKESLTDKNRQPKVKVNRFVDLPKITEICESCNFRVYPLEKISVHNRIYHKNCFKCQECNCVLRMDSYSYNQGFLYCMPHFKRLFISKGNYDTGFGLGQHKEKWNGTTIA